jgi:diadenosine tetraphosphate (Ap4A) HIT family hydrolase
MSRVFSRYFLIATLAAAALADVRDCACDVSNPQSMAARECGLCREAEKQPPETPIFVLKDINPRKPNRWLVLPRMHFKGGHALADMTPQQRTELWTAAMAKAKELFGDEWGLAYNGSENRTQCHGHIHVGKLLQGVETPTFVVVSGPAQIPLPKDDSGLWVHPVGGKLHVHMGEQITETVLFR